MCSIEWSMIHTRYSRRIFCSSEFLLWRNGHHTWPSLRFVLMTRPSLLPSKADQLLQWSLLQVGRIPPSLSFTNRTIWFEQELGGASILNILDGSRVWWLWKETYYWEVVCLKPSYEYQNINPLKYVLWIAYSIKSQFALNWTTKQLIIFVHQAIGLKKIEREYKSRDKKFS